MQPTTKKWLTGCGIGCGVVLVLAIVGGIGGGLHLIQPMRQAIEARESLDAQYPDQDTYTPPASGAVAADRLEAFLQVRSACMEVCDEFAATAERMRRLDELEEDTGDGEAMREGLGLTGDMIGLVPRMGRLYTARNETLAAVEMGLGEYTYIYVMAYREQIRSEESEIFGAGNLSRRVGRAMRAMLERQLDAVDAAVAGGADLADLRAQLADEIERLEAVPERMPWQDGLPPALAASLTPHRERLDAVFCSETSGLELNINRQRGLSIHGS